MSNHEQETLCVEQEQPNLDDKQSCDQCGAPFTPRRSSGGSHQRFCTTSCPPNLSQGTPTFPAYSAVRWADDAARYRTTASAE